jgi:putative oxidoreductase
MNKLLYTNANNWPALVARLALGITIFPHGAQKLLGAFGGYGFSGTMGFLTGQAGLPYVLALLVILIEFFGSLFLIFGFLTRFAALGFAGLFLGIVFKVHLANGFFMNWGGSQKGEGIEFFILLFGLVIISLILGGGKASVDAAIVNRKTEGKPAI